MPTKGFTLIETIFTLSVIVITSVFVIRPTLQQPVVNPYYIQESVRNVMIAGQLNSLMNHEVTDIHLERKRIYFKTDDQEKVFNLPQKCYLSHRITLYFNSNGNVNKGNHFFIHIGNKTYRCIIHVGSGEIKFE